MLAAYFSPLAPAAVLLLGAFILWLAFPLLLDHWQSQLGLQYFGPLIVVVLAILALLGLRLTPGKDVTGEGVELISGWNFSTAKSAAALAIRADGFSLIFLLLTCLILLSMTLSHPTLQSPNDLAKRQTDIASWLALSAVACLLFVSGDNLTLGYAAVAFDMLTTVYWLRHGQINMGIARLLLGILTAGGLALVTIGTIPGTFLFGLALWMRLGLYPFFEATTDVRRNDYGRLVYMALSLAVGFYLVIRGLTEPLPMIVRWLAVTTMLLNGLLTWLTDQRASLLTRLVLTEALAILLLGTLNEGAATALAVGLILSLVALWVTASLGKPGAIARAWPYLPAIGATVTLIGLPFSLGWSVRNSVYQTLLRSEGTIAICIIVLAEGLAFSGLVRYWLLVWPSSDRDLRQSLAGIIVMIPFLVPGLGPYLIAAITQTQLPPADLPQPGIALFAMAAIVAGGVGSGYFRDQFIRKLKINPEALVETIDLRWLLFLLESFANSISKVILRVRVFLEGQHYIGWALFTALAGALIILLQM